MWSDKERNDFSLWVDKTATEYAEYFSELANGTANNTDRLYPAVHSLVLAMYQKGLEVGQTAIEELLDELS